MKVIDCLNSYLLLHDIHTLNIIRSDKVLCCISVSLFLDYYNSGIIDSYGPDLADECASLEVLKADFFINGTLFLFVK